MVTCIDDGGVVGNQHFFITNDRANGGARWQVDLTDAPSDYLARLRVTVGDGFDGLGRTAPQRVHADDIAAAHVGQQGADGGQLRADGDVDFAALNQVHIRGVVDDGHDLLGPQTLGQQRRHDVGFVIVGQCQEQVGVGDVFLEHQVAVRGAALQHHRAVERVRQIAAACSAHFDDLDLITAFNGLGQPLTDLSAAGNHDALVALVQAAHFAHHSANVGAGCDEKDFVVCLDHGIATGGNRTITSENSRHACIHVRHMFAQLAQLLTNQRAAVVRLHRHQLCFAFSKVDHLQGAGVFDQAFDVIGHDLLGAD